LRLFITVAASYSGMPRDTLAIDAAKNLTEVKKKGK
jgi:hypothetical protein